MVSMSSLSLERVDCFSVFSAADPSALPRVLEVFSLYGLIPTSCHSVRHEVEDQLVVDLQVTGLPQGQADLIAKRLSRVVTVTQVLWSEKRQATRAAA
jgi:acetolactate synthase small subunit